MARRSPAEISIAQRLPLFRLHRDADAVSAVLAGARTVATPDGMVTVDRAGA